MKLRLLLTEKCNRNCDGCCNKQPKWKKELPDIPEYDPTQQYKEIMITGGEPMLFPLTVGNVVRTLKRIHPCVPVYMYTAFTGDMAELVLLMYNLDGICYTIHEQADVAKFAELVDLLGVPPVMKGKSLRVNIFKGIEVPEELLNGWSVKRDMEWIIDCPLPDDEVLQRYNGILDH